MSVTRISVVVILLVIALVGYRVVREKSSEPAGVVPPVQQADTMAETEPAKLETEAANPVVEPVSRSEDPGCLTRNEFLAHPLIQRIMSLRGAAASDGADVEKFRDLNETTVRDFAAQGESGAMVVVGAMSVMKAYRIDGARAVDWLANQGNLDGIVMQQQQMTPEASLALNDAAYWFYQAALNGRVFALQHYGQVRGQLFGGPVGLGWIGQGEFDALDAKQQQELLPENLYRKVALDLSPRPGEGTLQGSVGSTTSSDMAVQVQSDIHNEFNMAVSDADLPAPEISAGDLADLAELESRICVR